MKIEFRHDKVQPICLGWFEITNCHFKLQKIKGSKSENAFHCKEMQGCGLCRKGRLQCIASRWKCQNWDVNILDNFDGSTSGCCFSICCRNSFSNAPDTIHLGMNGTKLYHYAMSHQTSWIHYVWLAWINSEEIKMFYFLMLQ